MTTAQARERRAHHSMWMLLSVKKENYLIEIRKRLEIMGHKFPTDKDFKNFFDREIQVINFEKREYSMVYYRHGEASETILAWWLN